MAAVTESWLCDDFEDDQVSIGGYVVRRKDTMQCRGGGVCVYVSYQLPAKRCLDLEHPDLECMWLWTRPPRLPRSVSAIAVCVVYSPPHKRYPDCGVIILGDFNHLNIADLVRGSDLKQVVNRPTRRDSILDYMITNLHSLYESSNIFPPLGTSDHNSIMWNPKDNYNNRSNICVKGIVRRYPESGLDRLGLWASRNSLFQGLGPSPSTDNLATSFTV